jgi:hypothetical protein
MANGHRQDRLDLGLCRKSVFRLHIRFDADRNIQYGFGRAQPVPNASRSQLCPLPNHPET